MVARLLEHLPESQRSKAELASLMRAPQFRQALGQLTQALLTPENYNSVCANFGIDPAKAPLSGDPIECFLGAILNSVDEDKDGDATMEDAPK